MNRWGRISIAVLAVAIAAAGGARAELPPGSYDELRVKADEAVILEVESVKAADLGRGRLEVTVAARVLAVERSKAGLKPGRRIATRYESPAASNVYKRQGPRPVPILKEHATCPAFLNARPGKPEWEPAALGESFAMTPEA